MNWVVHPSSGQYTYTYNTSLLSYVHKTLLTQGSLRPFPSLIHPWRCIRKYTPLGQLVLAVLKSILPLFFLGFPYEERMRNICYIAAPQQPQNTRKMPYSEWQSIISNDLHILSVRVSETSHPTFSPLYDVLDHINHIFSETSWSKDIKTDITKCLIHKYTNTNTQIQHRPQCQKDPTCGIFLKRL